MSAQNQTKELTLHRDVDFDKEVVSQDNKKTPLSKYAVQRSTDKPSGPAMQSVYIADTITVTNSFNF